MTKATGKLAAAISTDGTAQRAAAPSVTVTPTTSPLRVR